MRRSVRCGVALALLAQACSALAQAAGPYRGDVEVESLKETIEVNADGTFTKRTEQTLKILTQQGVRSVSQVPVAFSESLQRVDVLEAWTIRADGQREDVAPSSISERGGTMEQVPTFTDIKSKVIVFPAVEVGARLHYALRLTQMRPVVPYQYSLVEAYSPEVAYGAVTVDLYGPAAGMTLRTAAAGVSEEKLPDDKGRPHWRWTYHNDTPSAPEPGAVDAADYAPRFEVSSFRDYAAIAEAYDDRAFASGRVTDSIRAKSAEIVGAVTEPREQARLLYEWVARNVRYATNLMGIGSVVPRDGEDILVSRFGDCKDHVALYQALLAARGIASVPALIDASGSYSLTQLPVFGRFNHVISYLPSFDLFVDPSADLVPFGTLPVNDSGKQVVLTAGFSALRTTPAVAASTLRARSKKVVTLHADGTVDGTIANEESAYIAAGLRSSFETMSPDDEKQLVSRLLNGYAGTGTLSHADPRAAGDSYSYGLTYHLANGWNVPGPGAVNIVSVMPTTLPVSHLGQAAASPVRTRPYLCLGGTTSEEYSYEFPAGVTVLALPKDTHIALPYLQYDATYRQQGQVVTVTRTATEPFAGHLCSPEDHEAWRKVSVDVIKDLRAQILYK